MLSEFKNPSNQFRPIPFWSWNDKLEIEELKFQIEEMKKAGVGGYFMHARSGLKTEYLSQEWFDCIKAGIEKGKEVGLDVWAYDEEGWPSGFAGGIVPALSPDYHAKFMTLERYKEAGQMDEKSMGEPFMDRTPIDKTTIDKTPIDKTSVEKTSRDIEFIEKDALETDALEKDSLETDALENESLGKDAVIAVYVYNQTDKTYKRIDKADAYRCGEGEELLAVRRHTNPFYIDTMNKRAVEAFLTSTHEVYYEKFGEDFGSSMKGFFTDEPRLTCNHFGELPWSDDLPEEFLNRFGYDVRDHIVSLYHKAGDYEKHRYNFWNLVSDMFVTNYMKSIYDWCDVHNCKSTGHIMMEESIFSQMTSTAGVMPFYEFLHIPGIDWLRRPISSPVIGKQVGSVACQLGKKQVLTESFALCGWNVSFEELKWIAEWQFVNGVNQICQHLQGYTIKGVRKRDYPPSLFLQQTWWEEYKKFNDYLGRLCVALSEGNQIADVLLIHPMHSGYVVYDGTRTEEIDILDKEFTSLSEVLSGSHISYHYGDETIIKRHGKVEGDRFAVGEIRYQTVILPHMYAIDEATLKLLLTFIENGGVVFSAGRFPDFTNGSREELNLLKSKVLTVSKEDLRQRMMEKNLVSLSILSQGKEIQTISYQQRDTGEGTILFLVNHSQTDTYHADITVSDRCAKVTGLIAESGDTEPVSYDTIGGRTHFTLTFDPMQSHLIFLKKENAVTTATIPEPNCQLVTTEDKWTIDKMDLNSMTLDTCSYRIDGGGLEGPIPVIKLQSKLMDLQKPCEIEMHFKFQTAMDLSGNKEFYAVIEDAFLYQIEVNGRAVPYEDIGYWKDKTFRKVDIKKAIKDGENEIVLKTLFQQPQKVYDVLYGENVYETEKNKITYDIELESIYLLGDFGVISETPFKEIERRAMVTEGPFTLADAPKEFTGKEFTKQGLAFFAGQLTISQQLLINKEEGKRIYLKWEKQNAPLIKVYINGELAKDSLWAPYYADITDYVKEGQNEITLHLYASNRNLFGPHHHIDGECYNVGPESFTGKWSWVERKSEADATDISDRDKNYWTDSYSFVEFGL